MDKVSRPPGHTDVAPVIAPGVGGTESTVTAKVCGTDAPQALLAVTETVPLEPASPVMALIVDPMVVQPFGSDHV